ncbi:xylose ABC transporter, periplasmic xylose-binding protein XylF [Desulfocucumis palustris]|uniref:Xylose ABC transporter, periplasmic xylose-binding protein XylF n=1 Tax=Desulfocucumis palustris TaxID=1898651 RepID=A0A2L2XNJ8_9FIRM|nr:substrate-binding domain-containing protein [Desulfocucumis palustris]GBF35541.1 xylose ABC transporter, periplasmic xylose-binding protein XylF [Desulfocucumis palustris]
MMVLPLRTIITGLLFSCITTVGLAGCGGRGGPESKPLSPPTKIAVCVADMERDGNKIIKKVMEERKKKEKLDITWLDAGNDPLRQAGQLEKLAGQKVKAVVLQPVDPQDGARLLRSLVEKNIKVVALETLPVDAPVEAYIASDHVLAGRLMAEYVINAVRKRNGLPVAPGEPGTAGETENRQTQSGQGAAPGGGQGQQQGQSRQQNQSQQQGAGGGQQTGGQQAAGAGAVPPEAQLRGRQAANVVLLAGDPGDSASREIAAAARAVLADSQWARVVAEYNHFRGDPAQVPFNLQQALAANKNGIDAVIATDSRLALSAVDVLKAAGLNNSVLTVGVGADKKASDALAAGEHDAEVDTRPDLLGQYALDAAVGLAKDDRWQYDGQSTSGSYSVPSRITPVRLVQPQNIYLLKQRWAGIKDTGKEKQDGGGQGGGGSSGGSGSGEQQASQGDRQGQQGQQGQKTMLKITTMDGKTVEVQINGQVKKIEATDGGQGQQGQGGQEQQEGGQGGQ